MMSSRDDCPSQQMGARKGGGLQRGKEGGKGDLRFP